MKKYIITDPSYILKDEYEKVGNATGWDGDAFFKGMADALEKLTGEKAYCASTLFGDWTNEMIAYTDNTPDAKCINSRFCADTGLVCVCLLTDEIAATLQDYDKYGTRGIIAAIVEWRPEYGWGACPTVKIYDPNGTEEWAVVELRDAQGEIVYASKPQEQD